MNDPDREETLFASALALPAEQRRAHIAEACPEDADLRQRVEELIKMYESREHFMADPAAPSAGKAAVTTATLHEKPGDRIGRYKLLEQIGEGGCGVVYMAEQYEPVRRRVALKLVRLGLDTRDVVTRFEAERQALAMMDHPNIARVFDGGATESGRPYFVMELVRGTPISRYCDERRLSTRERLALFLQVCQAVQHAHQKGIIHRDIKPSNVLVTELDGRATPKVIDFGVAKATEQRLTERTLFTRFGQIIGTPAYMSPEQAGFGGLDIDTRSDVYSLGVLLYELLTGQAPFDSKKLLEAGYERILQTIREVEPPKPSTRLSTLTHDELIVTAQCRSAEPAKLNGLLRGELDWIVMKAMEKDRTRRYETAASLSGDIQNFLANEPIVARRPSALYRSQKWVRRNKLPFLAGSAVVAALMVGLCVATWQARRATRAEQEQRRLRETAQKETEFLKAMLKSALPGMMEGTNIAVHLGILDQLHNAPETEAELRTAMADAYTELGLYHNASAMRSRATSLRQSLSGNNDSLVLRGPAIAIICGGGAAFSVGLAALIVRAFRRRLPLLAFVWVPLSLWSLLMAVGVVVLPAKTAACLLGCALLGTAAGASWMIFRPRRNVASPESKVNPFRVNPWLDALGGVAFLIALVGAFYAFENGRGKLAWEKCKRQYEAKGYTLDWNKFIPQLVPDEQNIFKAPKITEWFVQPQSSGTPGLETGPPSNDLTTRLRKRTPWLPIAELRVLPLSHTNVDSNGADLRLRYDAAARALFDLASGDSVAVTAKSKGMFEPDASSGLGNRLTWLFDPGESLSGATGRTIFKKARAQLKVVLCSETMPTTEEISLILAPFMAGELVVKPSGTNSFQLALSAHTAADYLKWSDQFAPDFDLIRQALKRPYARIDTDYSAPFETAGANLVAIRMVAQALQERAISHLLLDQPEEALADLTMIGDLCRLLDRVPAPGPKTLVDAMISVAIVGMYAATIEEGMRLGVWKEPQLVELQRQLAEKKLFSLVAKAFACEPAAACRWAETRPIAKVVDFGTTNANLSKMAALLWPRGWTYQNMVNLAQLEFKALDGLNSAYGIVQPRIENAAHSNFVQIVQGKSPFKLLAEVGVPNFSKACIAAARNQTSVNQVEIVCALERYRLANGDYPEALDALAPQFMQQIPHDVIGGQPLHYRRTARQKFLLYSVGWNETDEGGVSGSDRAQGDWVWK